MNIFKKFWNKLFKKNGQVDLEEIARLNDIIEQLTNKTAQLSNDNKSLKQSLTGLRDENKCLKNFLTQANKENADNKKLATKLLSEKADLYNQIARLKNEQKKQQNVPFNNKHNTLVDPIGSIKLNLHGFSTNDMYQYCEPFINQKGEYQDCVRTSDYDKWEKQFFAAMDAVTNNGKSPTLMFDHINFNRPLRIDVCFGMLQQYDGDNMIKSFLDTLVKYHRIHNKRLKNDNGFLKYTIEKKIVASRKEGFIQFSISNI